MSGTPCPNCSTTARQCRGDGRCVSCGQLLPEALRATGDDAIKVPQRRQRVRSDSPPIHQAIQLEVACEDFLNRQEAIAAAAASAVASLPLEEFRGMTLILIDNRASSVENGCLRLVGFDDPKSRIFFDMVTTRVRRWFRQPVFQVALTARLPAGSLDELISLIKDGVGLAEWTSLRGDRDLMAVFAAEIGTTVYSHFPQGRVMATGATPGHPLHGIQGDM